MIFPYQVVMAVSPVTGIPSELTRPEVLVGIEGVELRLVIGLLDSGADYSILPKVIAEAAGIELRPALGSALVGVSGNPLEATFGTVRFILEDDESTFEWSATALFHDVPSEDGGVLGRTGFLEYFTVTFDGENNLATLQPNSRFPGEVTFADDQPGIGSD